MPEPKTAGSGVWSLVVRPGSGLDAPVMAAWAAAVGAAVVPRACPWTLHDGLLTIHVQSSTWAQELSLRRTEILGRIGADLGAPRVQDLRFVVAPMEG